MPEFRTIRFSFVNSMEISMERCLRFRFGSMLIDKNGKNETSSPYRRTEHPVLTMNIDFGGKITNFEEIPEFQSFLFYW